MSDNLQNTAVVFKQVTPTIKLASHFSAFKQHLQKAAETTTAVHQNFASRDGQSLVMQFNGDPEKAMDFLDSPFSRVYTPHFEHEDKGVSEGNADIPAGTHVIEVTFV